MTEDEVIGIVSGPVSDFANEISLPLNSHNTTAIGKLITKIAKDLTKAMEDKPGP